jgi:hypothetical protein
MSLSKKAAKAKKIEVKPSVLDWCKQQVKDGKDLTIHWEGGGDSGWVYFQIDGQTVENEYTEYLVSMMYAELDYGSWAGEFSATGEATFDADEEAFVGIDNYSEDDTEVKECEFKFTVPKKLWFDSISIHTEVDEYDEPAVVEVSFNLKNGFLTSEHHAQADKISSVLQKQVDNFTTDYCNNNNDFRNVWDDDTFQLTDAVEKDDHLEFIIPNIRIGIMQTEEKDIYLQIDEEDVIQED